MRWSNVLIYNTENHITGNVHYTLAIRLLTDMDNVNKSWKNWEDLYCSQKKFSFSFCLSAAKIENMKLNLLFNTIYDAQDSIHVYAQLN